MCPFKKLEDFFLKSTKLQLMLHPLPVFLKLAQGETAFCDSLFSLVQNTLLFIVHAITAKKLKYQFKDMLVILWRHIFTSLQDDLLYYYPSVQ